MLRKFLPVSFSVFPAVALSVPLALAGAIVATGVAAGAETDAATGAETGAGTVAGNDAYAVIERMTERVNNIVLEAISYVEREPERFYRELQVVFEPRVDFSGFARQIMGPYASSERYQSLSAAGKQQLRAQHRRFVEVVRTGLVRTYGKGLIAFGGHKTEVLRPPGQQPDSASRSVEQIIHGTGGVTYAVQYQMRRDAARQWKIRNLIVENINLGAIYRNQFQAAAGDRAGDLDAVIDNWIVPATTADGAGAAAQ